jgi:hypothetical protein
MQSLYDCAHRLYSLLYCLYSLPEKLYYVMHRLYDSSHSLYDLLDQGPFLIEGHSIGNRKPLAELNLYSFILIFTK